MLAVAPASTAAAGDRVECDSGLGATPAKAREVAEINCNNAIVAGRFAGPIMIVSSNTIDVDPGFGLPGNIAWEVVVSALEVGFDGGDSGDSGDGDSPTAVDPIEESPPPPPCWASNNCPVGGALQVAVPEYMIAGVPQTLVVYAAWRPDENTPGAPSNGDAVISMDGEPVAAAPFEDGVATFNFTPVSPGLKDVKISGVLNSNTSGANAWIDSVDAATMVLPYDPEALEEALKNKKVEVGDTYTLEEIAQAKTALGKRLEWRVAQDSKDVCAVTTTKKGEVKAKFTESGKCSIIWTDPKKDEEGKYTFKVTA